MLRLGTLNAHQYVVVSKGDMTAIEIRIRAAIERAREQSSSIPDLQPLFLSLKNDFPEIAIATGDSEGERACIGLMLMTLKMLMPECKAIMEAYAKKQDPKTANAATKGSRVIPLYRIPGESLRYISSQRSVSTWRSSSASRRGARLSARLRALWHPIAVIL